MKIGLLFNQPLGVQVAPIGNFAPKRSATAAAIATGIGMGVGSLASAYANLKNQADTNEANREINRENLAWQKEQWKQQQENFKLQRKWQLEDTASERNWNSVQAQVARYRAAGLNPSLAMYGGAGQNQVQTGTVNPTAPSGSYPGQQMQMQPSQINLEGLGMSVGSAMQSYYNAKSEERADYALGSDITVNHMNARTNYMNAVTKAKEAGVNEQWLNKQMEEVDRRFFMDNDKFKHQLEMDEFARSIQDETLKVEKEKVQLQKAQIAISKELAASQIKVDAATSARLAKETLKLAEDINQMKIKGKDEHEINKVIKKKENQMVNILVQEGKVAKHEAENWVSGERLRRLASVIPFASGYMPSNSKKP